MVKASDNGCINRFITPKDYKHESTAPNGGTQTRPERPTASRSVNKTTPRDTCVTADMVSASRSQFLWEDSSYSGDMISPHSCECPTPMETSVAYVESDSESSSSISENTPPTFEAIRTRDDLDDARIFIRSLQRLADACISTSYDTLSNTKTALAKRIEQRLYELKKQYAVAFDRVEAANGGNFDLDKEVFEGKSQDTLQATHSIQSTETSSAIENRPKKREHSPISLQVPYAYALFRKPTNLQSSDIAQHQSQECYEAESIGDDVTVSDISRLEKGSIPEDTSRPVKQSPSATAKSSNATDTLITDSVPFHAPSLSAGPNENLATTLAADIALADAVENTNTIQHANTCWDLSCTGDCLDHLAHKADSTAPYEGVWGSIDGEAIHACAPGWGNSKTCCSDINPGDFDPKIASVLDDQGNPDDDTDGSATKLPTPTNYTVTYWATIEHNDQAVHITIDSSNVSGPEKSIIEGSAGMNKVWKWVQEKGLTNNVSLQDALDLAKDMQVDSPIVE